MKDIAEYIEPFYNQKRRHSTFGNLSPAEYEQKYQQKTLISVADCQTITKTAALIAENAARGRFPSDKPFKEAMLDPFKRKAGRQHLETKLLLFTAAKSKNFARFALATLLDI